MEYPKALLFFLLGIIVLSSCTIQKRVHNRGVYIGWKDIYYGKKLQTSIAKIGNNRVPLHIISTINSSKLSQKTLVLEERVTSTDLEVTYTVLNQPKKILNVYDYKVVAETKPKKNILQINNPDPEVNEWAILGIAAALISLAFLVFGSLSWGSEFTLIFSSIFSILSILFSSRGITKSFGNPNDLLGKVMSVTGLLIGITAILLWIFFVLLFIGF